MPACQSNPDQGDSITNYWMSRWCTATTDGIVPRQHREVSTKSSYGKVLMRILHSHRLPCELAATTSRFSRTCRLCANAQAASSCQCDEEARIRRFWQWGRSRKSKTVIRTLLPSQVRAARCSFPIATSFGASVDIRPPAPAGSA